MWSLELRSRPETGDTGRSEAGLNPNKQTKPKGWEEEAHLMDQDGKKGPRLTGNHKGKVNKLAQRRTGSQRRL